MIVERQTFSFVNSGAYITATGASDTFTIPKNQLFLVLDTRKQEIKFFDKSVDSSLNTNLGGLIVALNEHEILVPAGSLATKYTALTAMLYSASGGGGAPATDINIAGDDVNLNKEATQLQVLANQTNGTQVTKVKNSAGTTINPATEDTLADISTKLDSNQNVLNEIANNFPTGWDKMYINSYDSFNNPTQIFFYNGLTTVKTMNISYDGAGRLLQIIFS